MNLTALQHSAFLQSLGWAIANSLWQAAILWVVYQLVNASYKNATPKFRSLLSTTLLFAIFAWFTQTFLHRFFVLENRPDLKVAEPGAVFTYVAQANPGWKILLNDALNNLPYLSVAYLLLLIVFSIRLINSYRNISFIKTNGLQKPPVEWRLFTDKVALHIGIHKKIKLWFSEHVDVPATLGFLKPVILIPLASISQLSPQQLEAIILHELSHIKRNDYFINLFISIVETILFFNPFVVLLSKIIKRERENCCDDFVIQYKYDPHSYASALLSLEQSRMSNLRLAMTATAGKSQLLHRVKRIMENKNSSTNFNYGQKLLALILVTGIITSVAWLSPQKKETQTETAKRKNAVLSKPIREVKSKDEPLAGQQVTKTLLTRTKRNPGCPKTGSSFYEETKIITDKDDKAPLFTYDDQPGEVAMLPATVPTLPKTLPAAPAAYSQLKGMAPNLWNEQLLKELTQKIDLKKFQAAFDNGNFTFSFDWNKWHDEAVQAFQKYQLSDLMPGYQKLSPEQIEKLVQGQIKKLKTSIPRTKVIVNTAAVGGINLRLNRKLFHIVDSLASLSAAVLDKCDQNYFKKFPEADGHKLQLFSRYTPVAHSYSMEKGLQGESLVDEITSEQQQVKRKVNNYNYEYHDGVIIVKGHPSATTGEPKVVPKPRLKRSITFNSEGQGNNIIQIQIED